MSEIMLVYPEIKLILLLLGIFNMYMTVPLFFYKGCTVFQKIVKVLMIWFIPIVGALFIKALLEKPSKRPHHKTSYSSPTPIDDGGYHD